MTISSNTASASYTGNGTTAIFPVPFYFLTDTDLKVTRKTAAGAISVLTLNSDYTVSDAGNQAGGSITTIPALPANDQIFIERNVSAVQETAYPDNGYFPASSHERALDRLTMLAQQIQTALGFKLGRGPLSTAYDLGGNRLANVSDAVDAKEVPSLAQVQQLVTGAASGITPDDIATKSGLAAGTGAAEIGFQATGSGALAASISAVLLGFIHTPQMFGAVGDDVADDTVAVQNWVNACAANGYNAYVPAPAAAYRLTGTVVVAKGITLRGDGCEPFVGAPGTRGRGSWFHFAHSGIGFKVDGSAGSRSGVCFSGVGTFRDQPNPAPSWTPNPHDFDIYIDNADVLIRDVLLLNPTKGVYLTNGSYGRLEIDTLRGQAFDSMVHVDTSYDVVKVHNLHQWPFWKDDTNVHGYTQANLDVLYFERNDNPHVSNVFSIFARAGMRIGQNANGTTSKLHLVNADFDRGLYGVWVDSTVSSGATAQLANVTHQAETGLASSVGLFVQGSNSNLTATNFRSDRSDDNGIRVDGTGNVVLLSGEIALYNFNQSAAGFPAIEAADGNTIRIDTLPITSGGGLGPRYSSTGQIFVDEWRAYTPTASAYTGAITSASATGHFKMWDDSVAYKVTVSITTNGTGADHVLVTLPATSSSSSGASIGTGRAGAVSGAALQVLVPANSSQAQVFTYNNTYPGASGEVLYIDGNYPV
ncbi:MAG TPA: glycosyl hydrolase family 28-related protein [Frateuria sp.]|uniref:glycosyl hydrolase family 28-related protein n=1 Tax=Frateuria sp. TaxID=2211372 RepID=UPI002D7FD097|nr:glycosyl hydrolase family 28-related protein [Frateuria sp.]HET6807281.1 glycosyl hydrolase family 28-related protein [Frateuria sp.]